MLECRSVNAAANVRPSMRRKRSTAYCGAWMARDWGCLARAGASGRARSAGSQGRVPEVPHQIVGVVEGEELATRSKLMRRAGF